jgi:Mn2+/Fe2+ NRAMP family transporter
LQFATGLGFQWWALPVALGVWLLLWKGSFGLIEQGVSLLGLFALCFIVAAVMLHPPWREVGAGALPNLPKANGLHYAFIAVSILGAVISPYLFFFYSSGAIEEQWDKSYFAANRAIATIGMTFGAVISLAVLIVAALVFPPRGIADIESYDQVAMMLSPVLGSWGLYLFAISLGITCFGAALEVSLCQAYLVAQGFGWNWGEDAKPQDSPGFCLVYTGSLLIGVVPMLIGIDPLQMTIFSMAITAASLPFAILPFLFLMNDEHYVGEHRNGPIGNGVVLFVIGLAFVLSIVSIPLQILGG